MTGVQHKSHSQILAACRAAVSHSIRLVPWEVRASIKRIPLLAWCQRALLKHLLTDHEFVHRIDAGPAAGLLFPIVLPQDKGIWTGTYELSFVQAIAAAVDPGSICFDIGGWRGYVAGVMARAGASKVVIFEPLPANIERIRRMIELNAALAQFEVAECAVGDREGTAQFHLMPETSMGKLETSDFQSDRRGAMQIHVPVVSIDSFCETSGITHVHLIKLDIEGAELLALRGATRTLERHRPRLFVEAHSRTLTTEVTSFLAARSYSVTVLETGAPPDGRSEPEICHLVATPNPLTEPTCGGC
uniref:FkbM family methyltransferase n=1 Tax=Schlesneria paludicola TaxID=360056 RepID=A0A7C2JYQ1_9PLAN